MLLQRRVGLLTAALAGDLVCARLLVSSAEQETRTGIEQREGTRRLTQFISQKFRGERQGGNFNYRSMTVGGEL